MEGGHATLVLSLALDLTLDLTLASRPRDRSKPALSLLVARLTYHSPSAFDAAASDLSAFSFSSICLIREALSTVTCTV